MSAAEFSAALGPAPARDSASKRPAGEATLLQASGRARASDGFPQWVHRLL